MAINTKVWTNAANTESGKFVEIINDAKFPPTSASTDPAFGTVRINEYPKYAVLTYDAAAQQTNGLPFGDNASTDAFGKLRVTTPRTLLDSKHVTSKTPYTFNELLSGTATSTFIKGDSLVLLSTTNVNDFVIRQTYTHFNYQPGKSMQAMFTGLFPPQTNIIKRIGLFQSGSAVPYLPDDGIYLESSNNTISFHVQKDSGTPFHLSAAQADWNVDKLDGTGPSGISLDFQKAQIITFDYEWLGLGRVRCGFVVGGSVYYAHYFNNSNALLSPYITSPNQPVRYEIRQVGAGSGFLKHICTSVMAEGGEENVGTSICAELSAGLSVSTTLMPLLVLRMNPSSEDLVCAIKTLHFYNTGNTPVHYKLIADPVITGGTINNFTNIDGYTDVQLAYGSSALGLSGGYELIGGYVANGNSSVAVGSNSQGIEGEIVRMGSKIDRTPLNYVIAARAFTGTATSVYVTANLLLRA